jgi:spectrin alpha
VDDIQKNADKLKEKENFRSADIIVEVSELLNRLDGLEKQADVRFAKLTDNSAFLQFKWKADVVEAWIGDKESYVKVEPASKDLSNVQNLLTRQDHRRSLYVRLDPNQILKRQDAFDGGLQAFENEGINRVTLLKDELVKANHEQSEAIITRHDDLMTRWKQLLKDAKERREQLIEQEKHHQKVENLCLLFAKKASEFNSWFENAEEDLTDPVRCNSVDQIKALLEAHSEFRGTLDQAKAAFEELVDIDTQIKSFNIATNPYTWFDMNVLDETWQNLKAILRERENDLENK